ncbi:hypothetical protein KCU88_g1280, partial [Aureobasidium melanogenum]
MLVIFTKTTALLDDMNAMYLGSTLDWEKVPDKLHCAACHKFNLNAYKATCCDGLICESCFNNACDVSCPVCDHKPFTSETCKPNKAMRNTAKAYLKTVEKARAEERAKSATVADTPTQQPVAEEGTNVVGQEQDTTTMAAAATAATTGDEQLVETVEADDVPPVDVQPSIEDGDPESADLDDDVDIQVELDDDHQDLLPQRTTDAADTPQDDSTSVSESKPNPQDAGDSATEGAGGADFSNMMNGFGNMDYAQMMQMMAANGMPGFNPMMGMPMGMNPMSAGMFGGFGGPNGGMNGMNMGMNFGPNPGMFSGGWNNGQPNNMWQNNNANAFPNGMGPGDFGPNYGFKMGPNGNFPQSYPNGDFQGGYYGRGYGRGRGRGRGGYGRGRGNFQQFSQYQQGYQNNFDQRQHDNQFTQSQHPGNRSNDAAAKNQSADYHHDDDEFAPGGQEEIQEALGDDYQKPVTEEGNPADGAVTAENGDLGDQEAQEKKEQGQEDARINGAATTDLDRDVQTQNQSKAIPEAYREDLQGPMPPPSAPLGPSAQYGEHMKDFGFRARGHGRFPIRGRGGMPSSAPNGLKGHTPVNPQMQVQAQAPDQSKGKVHIRGPARSIENPRVEIEMKTRKKKSRRRPLWKREFGLPALVGIVAKQMRTEIMRWKITTSLSCRAAIEMVMTERPEMASIEAASRRDTRTESETVSVIESETVATALATVNESVTVIVTEIETAIEIEMVHGTKTETKSTATETETAIATVIRTRIASGLGTTGIEKTKSITTTTTIMIVPANTTVVTSKIMTRKIETLDTDHDGTNENTDEIQRKSLDCLGLLEKEKEKDPHTLEREARNRERLLKEQQRREKAAKANASSASGGGAGGGSSSNSRRITYKYEDELERGLMEGERTMQSIAPNRKSPEVYRAKAAMTVPKEVNNGPIDNPAAPFALVLLLVFAVPVALPVPVPVLVPLAAAEVESDPDPESDADADAEADVVLVVTGVKVTAPVAVLITD